MSAIALEFFVLSMCISRTPGRIGNEIRCVLRLPETGNLQLRHYKSHDLDASRACRGECGF